MNSILRRACSELLQVSKYQQKRIPLQTATSMHESRRNTSGSSFKKTESFFEPAYLDEGGPTLPLYDLVNIQVKGYDFPVLEAFESFVHRSAERFGLDVEDAWGVPCQSLKITRLKNESSVVEAEYKISIYERNVQLADVPSTALPLFVNVIEAALPAGVTLSVHQHEPEHTEIRYIPDYKLKELKGELETIQAAKNAK